MFIIFRVLIVEYRSAYLSPLITHRSSLTPHLSSAHRSPLLVVPSVKVNVFCPICKRKDALFGDAGEEWFIILAISDAMIRLSEWRLKLVLSIPSVSIFAFLTQ